GQQGGTRQMAGGSPHSESPSGAPPGADAPEPAHLVRWQVTAWATTPRARALDRVVESGPSGAPAKCRLAVIAGVDVEGDRVQVLSSRADRLYLDHAHRDLRV